MEQIYEVVEIRTEEVIASEIRTIVRQTQRTMLDAAIEIGRRLVEAKELVPHGGWGSWIKDKVHFSQSTANNFMQLYEEYGDRQGTLFGAVSNSQTFGNLSYTKALALLAVPEEDREDFAKKTDAANLSVRELERRIEAYQAEKEKADEQLGTLAEAIRTLEEEKAKLQKEGSGEDVERVRSEMVAEQNEILQQKSKSDDKVKKLEAKLEQLRADHQQILNREISKAVEEASAEAKAESEEELRKLMSATDEAVKTRMEVEKKLAASSSTDLIEFRFLVKELQENFSAAVGVLEAIKAKDPEMAANLHNGLNAIMNKLIEQL